MKKIFLLFFLISYTALALSNKPKHVMMNLSIFKNAGQKYLAVNYLNSPKWHTYWKNPGDAGIPTKLKISQNGKELKLTQLDWPAPKRYIEQGNIWAFGYSDQYTIFYSLSNSDIAKLKKGFEVESKWLVCKDICIPGKNTFSARIDSSENNIVSKNIYTFRADQKKIQKSFDRIPEVTNWPKDLEIYLNKDSQGKTDLALNIEFKNINQSSLKKHYNVLTPYPQTPFGFKHENLFFDQANNTLYGKMKIEWDGEYQEPEIPFPVNGQFQNEMPMSFILSKLENGEQKFYKISKSFKNFSIAGQKQLDDFYTGLSSKKKVSSTSPKNKNIFLIILYAFLGGLILNLMPCVLPVISLKLFGLIAHRDEKQQSILKHNMFYSLGVISTFMALGGIVVSIKGAGKSIGWGFQLQSPIFVAIMVIVIFALALNMFGLYEFRTPFGNKLGNAELKKGVLGDFFSGVLTTILSTPCSAPFLGAALTFAFTTTTANIFLTFIFIGLGLSFPFILTGLIPSLISFLPKPGLWMEKLKKFLGLTLLLTVVWLYDVLMNIVDAEVVGIWINTLLVLVFFGFYFHNKVKGKRFFSLLFGILPLVFFTFMLQQNLLTTSYQKSGSAIARDSVLKWESWDKGQMMSKSNETVFIDFTAKWCLTCKVNKKLVFETSDFEKLVKENKINLMIADWTKYDPKITKWLERYNVVSVPAYFVKTKSGEIKFLGETISISKIKDNL